MNNSIASLTVQTGIDAVQKVIQIIAEKIRSNNIYFELDPASFHSMLEEALLNAMHHGNRWNSGKAVNVTLQLDDSALYIIIADEGDGFCQLALTEGTDNTEKKGIRIIRKFCNPYWNDKGNTIYLKLPLSEEKTPGSMNAEEDVPKGENRELPGLKIAAVYSEI
jgi:anti-sigma regulatory factor (Ser/Thr protein kinase)